jgi:AraC-like DNA-binding protein
MNQRLSIPARSVVKILDALARYGVDGRDACHAAGIDPDAIADPDARLGFAQVVRLYEAGSRLSRDAAFGLHVGECSHPAMFDVVGYITMNSPTVGAALQSLERYQRVWTDGSTLHLEVTGRQARIEYSYNIAAPGPEGRRHDCEATLSIVTRGLRAIAQEDWCPEAVAFEHGAPADMAEHVRVFRAPIRFGQRANALVLDAAMLDRRIPQADPALRAVLDRHADALLAVVPPAGRLSDRVRHVLGRALRGGVPGLAAVARELGMSARTLQRRLSDEGTSHQILIEEMRRELSIRYLQQPDMSISDVAYLLGFAEPSTFHRAFRKWTGVTPGDFKKKALG